MSASTTITDQINGLTISIEASIQAGNEIKQRKVNLDNWRANWPKRISKLQQDYGRRHTPLITSIDSEATKLTSTLQTGFEKIAQQLVPIDGPLEQRIEMGEGASAWQDQLTGLRGQVKAFFAIQKTIYGDRAFDLSLSTQQGLKDLDNLDLHLTKLVSAYNEAEKFGTHLKRAQQQSAKTDTPSPDPNNNSEPLTVPSNPYWLQNYIEREEQQTLRAALLDSAKTTPQVIIQGLGGVGKTTLTRKLIHDDPISQQFGERIYWFERSNEPDQLTQQIVGKAHQLSLVEKSASDQEAIQAFFAYLERQKKPCLIVYDNAPAPDTLAPFLLKPGVKTLITTRHPEWKATAPLQPFTPSQAHDLIKALLDFDESWEALAKEMDYHPLGLTQACAAIKQWKLSIPQFLKKLENQKGEFLRSNHPLPKAYESPSSSISALWTLTFAHLEKTCPSALTLLDSLTFLAIDAIPDHLLDKLAPNPQAKEALLNCALIQQVNAETYTLHRLLQMVVQTTRTCKGALEKALTAFNQTDPKDRTPEALKRHQSLIPHGRALIEAPTSASHPTLLSDACITLGRLLIEFGQRKQSLPLFEQACAIEKKTDPQDRARLAFALNWLGRGLEMLGDATGARAKCEKALAIYKALHGDQHPKVANSLVEMGSVLYKLGKAEEAQAKFEEALGIYKALYGDQQPEVANFLVGVGSALFNFGKAEEAQAKFEKALRIYKAQYGEQHPEVARSLVGVGNTLFNLGDAEGAQAKYEEALRIYRALYGDQHPDVANSLVGVGNILFNRGRAKEALAKFEEVLRIYKALYGDQHPDVARSLNNPGLVLLRLGDAEGAQAKYEEALRIYRALYGDQHPEVARSLNNLGLALSKLGDKTKAKEKHTEAYTLAVNHPSMGPDHTDTKLYKRNLDGLAVLNQRQQA